MGNSEKSGNSPCNILIIGDWFVDEYWFLVRHYSDISSHVGPLHYRIYSKPEEYVKNLCGAGLVAQVLYQSRQYNIINENNSKTKDEVLHKLKEKLESTFSIKIPNTVIHELKNMLLKKEKEQNEQKAYFYFIGEKFSYYLKKEIVYNKLFKDFENKILEHTKKNKNIYEVNKDCLSKLEDLPHDILKILRKMKEQEFKEDEFLNKFKIYCYELEKFQNKYNNQIKENREKLELLLSTYVTKSYELFGLGNWYKDDKEIIQHLIHARERKEGGYAALASFCIESQKCKDRVDITLDTLRPDYPTIRVIRQYHLEGNEFKQTNRIDWEPNKELLKLPEYEEKVKFNELTKNDKRWNEILPSKKIDAIVIEDHNKGVIEEEIINDLKKYINKDTKWYIRTKRKEDELENLLKRIDKPVELLVLGPEVASRSYPCEALLVDKTKITRQAFDLIDDIKKIKMNDKEKQIKNIVLLSDKREVLAVLDNGDCIIGESFETPTSLSQVGWTTVFFASLIHEIYNNIGEKCEGKSIIKKNNIKKAINDADKLGGVSVPESIRLNDEESKTEENDDKSKPEPYVKVLSDNWNNVASKWKQAMEKEVSQNVIEGYGIIKKNDSKVLEVWRGSTDLPGYLVWVKEKREYIRQIWHKIREFKTAGDKRSLAILLYADPAAGKSFLAEKLSDSIGFKLIQRDITQMIHRDDLLDLFDDIATAQAEKGSKVLVFVDEINAKLDSGHVYGAFLTPIESGYYIRRGLKFNLKPCVWIFAGTKSASKEEEKLPDFKSRMTMKVEIDYKSLEKKYKNSPGLDTLEKEAKLEQVYLGAIKIRDNFPDVSKVDKAILEEFYELDPSKNPYREIRKLAASLQNVQYGIVKRKNCTSYEWEDRFKKKYEGEYKNKYKEWLNGKEDLIELKFAKPRKKEKI